MKRGEQTPMHTRESLEKSEQDLEQDLNVLLSQIPDDLAEMWTGRFENKPNDFPDIQSRIRAIARVVEHRQKKTFDVEKISFALDNIFGTDREKMMEQIISSFQKARTSIETPSNFIGKGNIAEVYVFGESPKICFKVVANPVAYRDEIRNGIGNAISREYEYLIKLRDFEIDGCRTPKPFFYMPGDREGYGMETLDAFNVRDVLLGVVPFPNLEKFDHEKFSSILIKYVEAMHMRGIVHGDLWPRNVMIDKETLLPRVIDFGRSKDLSDLSESEQERYKQQDLANAKSIADYFVAIKKGENLDNKYL